MQNTIVFQILWSNILIKTNTMENYKDYEEANVKSMFDKMAKELHEEKFYTSWIDNLNIDVKYKNFLKNILNVTEKVGKILFNVGKLVINILIKTTEFVMKKFPNATLTSIICAALGSMTFGIPYFGPLIYDYVAAFMGIVGGIAGFYRDIKSCAIRQEACEYVNAQFSVAR